MYACSDPDTSSELSLVLLLASLPAIFPKMTPAPVSLLPPGYLSNYKPTFISSVQYEPGVILCFQPSNDVTSTVRSGDHEVQQEPRGADASTILHSAKTLNETLTNKHAQCGVSVYEKSITGKSTGSQVRKEARSVPTEESQRICHSSCHS